MRILEKKDVQEVFEELLNQNGNVTSKEVKDELRERGFWAIQAQVSSFIKQNYKIWGTTIQYNGQYNVYIPEDNEENVLLSTNNIASITVDIDEEDCDLVSTKTKCKITTTQRISDDEFHINVYSPKEMKNINVIVRKFDFEDAQYIISYKGDIICYVGSKDTTLTNKQVRYYAWKIYKDDYPGMEYFDVRCNKFY